MSLIESGCVHLQILAVQALAHQGDLCELRQQLTAMLRCSGQLGCHEAVMCSDQAMAVLRDTVLPGLGAP